MSKVALGSKLLPTLLCAALAGCGGGGDNPASTAYNTGSKTTSTDTTGASADGQTSGSPAGAGPQSQANAAPPPAASASTEEPVASNESMAMQARFNAPSGIAADGNGTMFVADAGNNTVRKITRAGNVTTIAGSPGTSGSADGSGTAARFSALRGIAVDGSGNVYVVDNNAIRRITPAGLVTTVAGAAGVAGNADGVGTAARFSGPWDITTDASGNVYVADTGNYLIRRVSTAGVVTTVAGLRGMRGTADGGTATATFLGPRGIVRDPAGNLFITDWYGPPAPNIPEGSTFVRRIASDGNVSTVAGTYGSEVAPPLFRDAHAVAADASGNLYVAEGTAIIKTDSMGKPSMLAPVSATDIAADGSGGLLFSAGHAVYRLAPDGEVTVIAGQPDQSGSTDVP